MKTILESPTSDKTKIYTYTTANKLLPKLKSKKYAIKDLILMLLCAQENKPIHGRIMLMKEIFLLYRRQMYKQSQDPKFVPYRFGPYSFHITEVVGTLNLDGLIGVKGRKNSNSESFTLTEKGKKEAKKIFNKLPKSTRQEIISKRKGWDQLGTDGILNYVYTHYPKYKEKSVLKHRYKDIVWGNG